MIPRLKVHFMTMPWKATLTEDIPAICFFLKSFEAKNTLSISQVSYQENHDFGDSKVRASKTWLPSLWLSLFLCECLSCFRIYSSIMFVCSRVKRLKNHFIAEPSSFRQYCSPVYKIFVFAVIFACKMLWRGQESTKLKATSNELASTFPMEEISIRP